MQGVQTAEAWKPEARKPGAWRRATQRRGGWTPHSTLLTSTRPRPTPAAWTRRGRTQATRGTPARGPTPACPTEGRTRGRRDPSSTCTRTARISGALSSATAGEVIVVHGGSYPALRITDIDKGGQVVITAADSDMVTIDGDITLQRDHDLSLRGLAVHGRITLDQCSNIEMWGLDVDPGAGSRANTIDMSNSDHIAIVHSRVARGVRTIALNSGGTPPSQWVSDVRIADDDLSGGERCIHVVGGLRVDIEHNSCHGLIASAWAVGVQLSGSDHVTIEQNRFVGPPGASIGVGITIGKIHETFAGSDYLTVSNTTIENNLVTGFQEQGILLEGTTNTTLINNTSWDNGPGDRPTAGVETSYRAGGNTGVRSFNNLYQSIRIASGDPPFDFESHDMVQTGTASAGVLVADPMFVDHTGYELTPGSPAIDAGIDIAGTPAVDLDGNLRSTPPDLGALEQGASPPPLCE